jgi:hypothetical protein
MHERIGVRVSLEINAGLPMGRRQTSPSYLANPALEIEEGDRDVYTDEGST